MQDSLNIEKRREKKGVIIEDEDDTPPRPAPQGETVYGEIYSPRELEDRGGRSRSKPSRSSSFQRFVIQIIEYINIYTLIILFIFIFFFGPKKF